MVAELESRLDRLRQLYDQYFLGYEKLEPQVPRKDVERRVEVLRREQIRNTALRFRFTVVTQKLNTYQSLWHRTCRAIEDGTFKRHMVKAQKRFGANAAAGKKAADIELDIDVDLGELEADVASDMEAISDEERRILAKVEAELRGESVPTDTERPEAPASKRRIVVEEDDDGDDDMPTNRPPGLMDTGEVVIPKSPNVPGVERSHTAAPFGNSRPNIRKTDPGAPRAAARLNRNTPPPFDPHSPVMPKVPSAPPPAMRESASKIALPVPGRQSAQMRAAHPASTSMRLAPPGSASSMRAAAPAHGQDGAREAGTDITDGGRAASDGSAGRSSGHMRAALPVPGTSIRIPPPGAQARMAPPGTRTSPGPISQSMRAAQPAPTTNPGAPPSNPSIRLPPPGTTARGSLPMPGGTAKAGDVRVRTGDVPGRRTGDVPAATTSPPKTTGDIPAMRPRAPSIGNSKPPPPLPSTITQRHKQPSLADLTADTKDKEKK